MFNLMGKKWQFTLKSFLYWTYVEIHRYVTYCLNCVYEYTCNKNKSHEMTSLVTYDLQHTTFRTKKFFFPPKMKTIKQKQLDRDLKVFNPIHTIHTYPLVFCDNIYQEQRSDCHTRMSSLSSVSSL